MGFCKGEYLGMDVYSNDDLFYGCYKSSLECDKHHKNGDIESYYTSVDEWKYWYDEIKARSLELAYMEYCVKKNLVG